MSGLRDAALIGVCGALATAALLIVLPPGGAFEWALASATVVTMAAAVPRLRRVRPHNRIND